MINQFMNIISVHGCLRVLISDNVPFGSSEFRKFCHEYSIELNTSSPNYPQSNGLAERAVQIAKQMLRKAQSELKELSELLLEYRCTTIPHLGAAPCELLLNRLVWTKFPILETKLKPRVQNGVTNKIEIYRTKYKQNYDKTAKDRDEFVIGEQVMIRENNMWIPSVILSKDPIYPRSYMVEGGNGILRRTSKHIRRGDETFKISREVDNDDLIISINNEEKVEIRDNYGLKEVSESLSMSPKELTEKENDKEESISEVSESISISTEELKTKDSKNEITRVGRVVKLPNKLNL